MKSLRLVTTPTRNRRLNEILGLTLLVAAGLLLLALASYTPTDPSFNTIGSYASGRPAHNWTGMVGAYFSDAILQIIGVAAFFLPLVLGRLGLCWMRSRPAGSPKAKTIGLTLWVIFAPAAIALLPGHLLWRHSLPVEGVTGRLLSDAMLHYLNLPGASIVLALMVALSLYLATTFTFNTASEWAAIRFGFIHALWQRWANFRNRRANAKMEKREEQFNSLQEEFHSKRELMEEKARRCTRATGAGGCNTGDGHAAQQPLRLAGTEKAQHGANHCRARSQCSRSCLVAGLHVAGNAAHAGRRSAHHTAWYGCSRGSSVRRCPRTCRCADPCR